MAKKKKKQPAVARNKGTPIDLSNREIPEEKVEEKCEEVIKKEMIRGTITSYTNKQVTIQYEEQNQSKEITHTIENRFLTFSKDILFGKKKNRDEVTIIYMQLLPKDLQGIEIDNLALKINRFPLMELKNKDEVKFHFQDSYCVEYEQKKIDDYYSAIKKLPLKFSTLLDFKTSYRLVIGGEATVYETSMRLHHIYGIPYIPASGIKGVVRSYIITEKFEEQLKKYDKYSDFEEKVLFARDEKGEYKEKGFVDVFGSQEQEGKVTFFDAFPVSEPKLKVDIMNPHYGDYYSKKVAPTDTMKLNPIPFLTVENTKFGFLIGAKEKLSTFKIGENTIETWLTEALKNHGLGAKTAVGYGYFIS